MPNSSVLWVFLIVVWLFVLVPMVLRGRPEARKSTATAAQTRVVHRGGSRGAAARRRATQARSTRAEGVAKRLAERKAAAEAASESTDDAVDETLDDLVTDADAEVLDAEIVDGETVDDATDAEADVDSDVLDAEIDETGTDDAAVDETDLDEAADAKPVTLRAEAESPLEVTDVFEPVDVDVVDIDRAQAARADVVTPHDEDDDLDDSDAAFDILDDEEDVESAEAEADDNDHVAPTPRAMRGTGGYGPGRAQDYDEASYRERRRVLATLTVLTTAAIVSAFFLQPLGYVAAGVMVAVFAMYLVFLRRAVRADQIRHAQRMARQRRRRAEDERVERVHAEPGYVAPPARLRRPGGAIVLEIDDGDPAFEHLPTYDFAYREDYDTDYDDVAHRTAV
ncbi:MULTISPECIES: gephyrin-like molybdotransferase receptor GlpR [Gordonia]|uniref:divisome protein SepX/GlpR n=1 Tax=Gordonia TaxID=2053 RepID=UPI0030FDFEDB